MKIQPPKLVIPKDNPYENDLFHRKDFGESLKLLLKNTSDSSVICINAPWGDGKTSFAKMWIADLKLDGIDCVYYNAYEQDYCEDPFLSFSAEIISILETVFKENSNILRIKKEFKNIAIVVGKKILSIGARIGIKAATLGIIKDSDIDAIESIKDDLAVNSSKLLSDLIEKKLDNYIDEKTSEKAFKTKLAELGSAFRDKQKFPLLIIIDELDRCRPDFALMLIERIKHYFLVEDVSFLLLANLEQLQNYISSTYGQNIDAHNYLHKFITISTNLPKSTINEFVDDDYIKFISRLCIHHGLKNNIENVIKPILLIFFKHFNFSLREIEKSFAYLVLFYTNLPYDQKKLNKFVVFLSIIKVRFPDVFHSLSTGTISYDDLNRALKLYLLQTQYQTNFLNLLKCFLLSNEEYNSLSENELKNFNSFIYEHEIDRRKFIPLLCNDLIKFRIQIS